MNRISRVMGWTAALLLSALSAVAVCALTLNLILIGYCFVVALAHAFIFGLPLALIYRARRGTRLSAAILGGFLIGAIPSSVIFFVIALITGFSFMAVFGLIGIFLGFGAFGALAGLVFWLVLKRSGLLEWELSPDRERVLVRIRIWLFVAGALLTVPFVGAVSFVLLQR